MKISYQGRHPLFLSLVSGALAYEWLDAGIEKFTSPAPGFPAGMTGIVKAFASKNPNSGFKNFLLTSILPHATGYGYVVMYGEVLVGIGLALGALAALFSFGKAADITARSVLLASLFFAALMNYFYWQAAGWTSVSTQGINVEMLLVALVLGASAITEIALLARSGKQVTDVVARTTGQRKIEPERVLVHH